MKMRPLYISMAGVLSAFLLASPVIAQDVGSAGSDEASKPYDGGSYTIVPPASWMLVSGTLTDADLSQLPPNIKEHFIQRNTDVIFLKKDSATPKAGFVNNLNVVIINDEIMLTDEVINEIKPILTQQYESMFKPFNFEVLEKRQLSGKDVLYVKGNYSVLNYSVTLEQYLIASGTAKESFILSCTYDTETGKEDGEACVNAIKSFTFK